MPSTRLSSSSFDKVTMNLNNNETVRIDHCRTQRTPTSCVATAKVLWQRTVYGVCTCHERPVRQGSKGDQKRVIAMEGRRPCSSTGWSVPSSSYSGNNNDHFYILTDNQAAERVMNALRALNKPQDDNAIEAPIGRCDCQVSVATQGDSNDVVYQRVLL